MEEKLFLIKLGEISLKGLNRPLFEKRLKNNIKLRLRPYYSRIKKEKGRLYLYCTDCPDSLIISVLSTTFGVVAFSKSYVTDKNWDSIVNEVNNVISYAPFDNGIGTFKVISKRADKNFMYNSYKISCELGGVILYKYPNMKVKLDNPEKTLNIEIRDKAYIYTSDLSGPSGLPCGVSGKGLLLLSGGIDSPVAGYLMSSRGMKIDCIYFHAYPYTSEQALTKVEHLAEILAKWNCGVSLNVVNFTKAELWIKDHSRESEHTLMMRACMIKVSTELAKKINAKALITGESLAQVASQTLDSISFTNSMTDLPVFRPLIGHDKDFIIDIAKKMGTYETSILPYDDCCTIFSPKHPLLNPDTMIESDSFQKMNIQSILDECLDSIQTKYYSW